MNGRWQAAGAREGNWGSGDVTGTLGGIIGVTGNARTLRVNTKGGRGADCARRRNFSERVAKAAA